MNTALLPRCQSVPQILRTTTPQAMARSTPSVRFGLLQDTFTRSTFNPKFAGIPVVDADFPRKALGLTIESVNSEQELDEVMQLMADIEREEYGTEYTPKQKEGMKSEYQILLNRRDGKLISSPGERNASNLYRILDRYGKVVGLSAIVDEGNLGRDSYGKWGMLHSTYLDPQYRGKGIGNWLMEKRLHAAQQAEMDWLAIEAKPSSRGIAEKHGFRPATDYGIPPSERQKKYGATLMILTLTEPFPQEKAKEMMGSYLD